MAFVPVEYKKIDVFRNIQPTSAGPFLIAANPTKLTMEVGAEGQR